MERTNVEHEPAFVASKIDGLGTTVGDRLPDPIKAPNPAFERQPRAGRD